MSTEIIQISAVTIDNPRVKKVADTKNIAIAIILLLIAVAMVAASSLMENSTELTTMSLFTAGAALLVYAVYLMLNKSKKIIYNPSGSSLKHYTCYIDPIQRNEAQKWADAGFKTPAADYKKKEDGCIRFDVVLSDDKRFAAVQLSNYENFRFDAYGEVAYLYNEEVENISGLIK